MVIADIGTLGTELASLIGCYCVQAAGVPGLFEPTRPKDKVFMLKADTPVGIMQATRPSNLQPIISTIKSFRVKDLVCPSKGMVHHAAWTF